MMTFREHERRKTARDDAPRRVRRSVALGAFAVGLAALTGVAAATAAESGREIGTPPQCRVPDETALVDAPLPRLARRLTAGEPLTIVVMGSGSAAGSGTSRKEAAFPARLEARIATAFPKTKVRVVVLAQTGQTAPAMHARIRRDVLPLRPALVIWQTGSADLAGGVSVTEFEAALERGIAELQGRGTDVVLVDGQFSPRGSLMINTDAYRDAVRWNARRYDVPLLRRYDTMQYWWNNQVFDLDAQDKAAQLDTADRIHDCVAGLLWRAIGRGLAEPRS